MSTLLLPPVKGSPGFRKRGAYCTLLTDVVRASVDAKEALDTFAGLLGGETSSGFTKFDAHVGETGCHLRATMLREAFIHFRRAMKTSADARGSWPGWMAPTVARLWALRNNAEQLCYRLTHNHADPRSVGLGRKGDTPERILRTLDSEAPGIKPIPARPSTEGDFNYSAIPLGLTGDCPRATWNLECPAVMVRFLVYCYTLSKYKQFFVGANGGCCRLQPEWALEQGQSLMEPFWNPNNTEYTVARITRIKTEFTALQVWMSELSCSWLQSLSFKLSRDSLHSNLVRTSFKSSSKGIVSSACFPTFLLLRESWAVSGGKMLLVDRHFCSQGWHFHVLSCRLHVRQKRDSAEPYTHMTWELSPVDIARLDQDSGSGTPRLVIMGNSIRGPNSAYVERVLARETGSSTSRPHRDEMCAENLDHMSDLLSADHDRLSMAFFANHKAYSIPVTGSRSEDEVSRSLMESVGGHPQAEAFGKMWHRLRGQVGALGAGDESLGILGWQHIFAETDSGLARLLKKWLEDENMMILSAEYSDNTGRDY